MNNNSKTFEEKLNKLLELGRNNDDSLTIDEVKSELAEFIIDENMYESVIDFFESKEISIIESIIFDDEDEEEPDDSTIPELNADNIVRSYLNSISQYKLLTAEEEIELAKKMEAGDKSARTLLINSNLRLVVSIAKRYLNRGVPFMDLIQEGNIGLVKAVDKFDYRKGNKLSTFATWWIRQTVSRSLANQGKMIRIPVYITDINNKVRFVKSQLTQKNGCEPTIKEIAAEMNMSVNKLNDVIEAFNDTISLDTTLADDSKYTVGDMVVDSTHLTPEEYAEHVELSREVEAMLDCLKEREAEVIKLRFGFIDGRQFTLEEIAEIYGVRKQRIRAIEQNALAKLKKMNAT